MERKVRFDLFGQEFSFYTDSSEEEVEQVINVIRAELDDLNHGTPNALLSTKMMVLCCLKLAAKYVQLEKDYDRFRNRQDESIDKLIHKVSSGIDRGNT